MLVAIILASGKGSRLAPLSTEERPKQYLNLISNESMINDTINRINKIISNDNIFVVTNVKHKTLANDLFGFLPNENIIYEPEMKETLASITHSISYISKIKKGDVSFLILPSDHYIDNLEKFSTSIIDGYNLIKKTNRYILYGVVPRYPSIQYGYIKTTYVNNEYLIDSFIEKPNLDLAKELISNKNYYWNNGIFITNKNLIFKSIKKHLPNQYELLSSFDNNKITTLEYFEQTYISSFSKAILEKEKEMLLLPVKYDWYDIGGFDSLFEVLEKLNKFDKITEFKKLITTKL